MRAPWRGLDHSALHRRLEDDPAWHLAHFDLEGIEREAGQASLRHADLVRRFGLVAEVPCSGTDLQGRCKLLGDAREAQVLLPSVDGQIAALRERRRAAETERATDIVPAVIGRARAGLAAMAGAPGA